MYNEPLVGNVLVPNPRKGAGKTAVCVQVSKHFPTRQNRHAYPAGFYVKGWIDSRHFKMVKLIKLEDGSFLFPVPSDIRRKLKKAVGDEVNVRLEKDRLYYGMHNEFMMAFFQEPKEVQMNHMWLSKIQQHRYHEWMWTAKDDATRADRIARSLFGLRHGLKFEEMRKETKDWGKWL